MALYNQEQIHVIASKIKEVQFGMLTTVDANNRMSSRPLTSQQVDDEGNMWFFASDEAAFTHDLERHPAVNISFARPDHHLYLSVSGHATLLRDRHKAQELWNPLVKIWYVGGIDDPHLVLIRVKIHSAEYWDASSSKMKQLLAIAKAAITGERPGPVGEHTTICL
ncbi:MAG: pyridoxamine 5'-phosphate oxidase family protein [Sphingomonadaceae bacterium]